MMSRISVIELVYANSRQGVLLGSDTTQSSCLKIWHASKSIRTLHVVFQNYLLGKPFRQLGNKCFQEFKSLIGANSFPPQKHVNWVVTPTAETNRLLLWVDSIFFWINMCQRGIFYGSAWQSEHFYLTPKWTKVSEEITVIPFNFVTKPNPMDSFCFFLNELNTCSWQLSLQKKRRKKEEKKKKTAK